MVLLVVGYGISVDVDGWLGRSEWLCAHRGWFWADDSALVDFPVMDSMAVIVIVIVDVV